MRHAQVIVSGACPAGIVAAYRLAQSGVDVLLLEANAGSPRNPRASTLNPATLDMMEELGWIDDLKTQGLCAPVYQHRNRLSGEVLQADFGDVADELRHPYRLHCEEQKLTALGLRKLTEHGHGQIRFQHRLVGLEQDAAGVTVYAETIHGIECFHCDYLVLAEGANALAHRQLGVQFEGYTWPQKLLALSSTYPIDHDVQGLAYVNYMTRAEDWCVLLRAPLAWHVLTPVDHHDSDDYLLSDAKKDSVFAAWIGEDIPIQTQHRAVHRVHQRVADRYDQGRVVLIGDAAHINIPLGGWGMNSGIHDAWNVTEKLDAIVNDGADAPALLGRYNRQRRTLMHEFVSVQIIRMRLSMNGSEGQARRQSELEAVLKDDARRRDYLLDQAMVTGRRREAQIH
jgi:3-(3-hydroxy-phenyl)propionate hydroxylase